MFSVILVNIVNVQIRKGINPYAVRYYRKSYPISPKNKIISETKTSIPLSKKPLQQTNVRIYSETTMSRGWHSKQIVPKVIDHVPPSRLTVEYPSISISEGIIVKAADAKDMPQVKWKACEPKSFFTLLLTNPTAPKGEWIHWLVVNIPDNNVENGETIVEYAPPCPPKDVPHHLHIALLYRQPTDLSFSNETKISRSQGKERIKFSTKTFAKKYGYNKSYAGNFFESQYDDTVPEIWKSMGYNNFK